MQSVLTWFCVLPAGCRCCSGASCWCPGCCLQQRAVRGWMWAPPTCLYFQIEDGGLGVPRRAAPFHRRRERRHPATLGAAALTVRGEEHTGCCPHQSLQWWVDLSRCCFSDDRPVLMLYSANANTANLAIRSVSPKKLTHPERPRRLPPVHHEGAPKSPHFSSSCVVWRAVFIKPLATITYIYCYIFLKTFRHILELTWAHK